MKTVLITGVAGFIGSHLSDRLLENGWRVIGIDNFDPFYSKSRKQENLHNSFKNPHFSFHEIDIRNKLQLLEINDKIDVVVHLAAKAGVLPSIQDPQEYISTNISGTFNVLELMKERGIKKLVFSSSSSVYGNNKKIPFCESDIADEPISPYAFTKRACELMNYNYFHLYKIDILNLRFFTVYGPRQRPDLAIHKFVNLIEAGKPIQMYGDGDSARDYTYIDDTVQGVIKAMAYIEKHDDVFDIINIGNKTPVRLKDLISKIHLVMDAKENIEVLPFQQGDVDITYSDISKAQKLLDYNPSTLLEVGLRKFIQWHKANKLQ
jgi:UDP-glucuronate 4-epimerase